MYLYLHLSLFICKSLIKVINELLYGIRMVKFYAWEKYFFEKINSLRQDELNSLKMRKYLDACCAFFWATTPVMISVLTFVTYILLGKELTAAKVRLIHFLNY